jgi:hypothetical protein
MFAIGGIVQILLHLGPSLLGLGFSEYQYKHPHAFDKEKIVISRFLQQGNSSHKAVKHGQHKHPGP